MLAFLAAALLLVLLLVQYARSRLHFTSMLASVPGPSYPLPVLGNLLHMLGPMDSILARGLGIYDKFGPGPIKFWIGETPSIQLMRPEDIEPVLSSQREVEKPELIYKPVRGFFGQGLITLNGDAWFAHRRALTPAFHFSILERYAGIFTRRGAAFAKQLAAEVPAGQSFNIMKFHSALVTETVMETAFGIPPDVMVREKSEVNDFVKATADAFSVIIHRIFHPWLLVDAIFKLSATGRIHARCEAIISTYAKKVIAAKKAELEERRLRDGDEEDHSADNEEGARKKYTFLDMALGGKAGVLTDDEILGEVRTLIAVQQTSASTLSFIMVMLALHPGVQEAARREVRDVDADEALHPLERLKRLKYIERVIKETLRLYPITAIFSRMLKSDVQIPGHTLPAGVLATMFVYKTHRDPRHWPDPERFDPDRFLPDHCVGRHPYAYVPFSAGPRNCIGQRYAMLQMKAVVAAVLARFAVLPGQGLESTDKIQCNMDTFLYIKGGFNVRLQPLQPVDQ